MSHRNSPLSPTGRLRLARCVVDDRWPLRRAADRFNVSVTTAKRWADRYRDHGPAGMGDRSSRPRSCPHRTSRRRERRVVGLRVSRRWGPARIGYHLGLNVSTVHRILTRGGIFMYPADARDPDKPGKLRLMYEANPMAFIVEQAGGAATDGKQRILDIQPEKLHQRVAVFLGSKNEVELVSSYHRDA